MTQHNFEESTETKPNDEFEDKLASNLELTAASFYEAPTDDDLFNAYVEVLIKAMDAGRPDLVEEEYTTLLYDSDLAEEQNMEKIFEELESVFKDLLGDDFAPEPPEENNTNDKQQLLFDKPEAP